MKFKWFRKRKKKITWSGPSGYGVIEDPVPPGYWENMKEPQKKSAP